MRHNSSFPLMFFFIFCQSFVQGQGSFVMGSQVGVTLSDLSFSSGFSNEYTQIYRSFDNKLLSYHSSTRPGSVLGLTIGYEFDRIGFFWRPAYQGNVFSFSTNDIVEEPLEGVLEVSDNQSTYSLSILRDEPGIRSWFIRTKSISNSLFVKFKVLRSKLGVNLLFGGGLLYTVSGQYSTEFRNPTALQNVYAENPRWFTEITEDGQYALIPISNEYASSPGEKIYFGPTQLDVFRRNHWNISPGIQTYLNLDEDGKLKLTFDYIYNFGLTNMYSAKRKDYLRSKSVPVVQSEDHIEIEPISIRGTQKMRYSTIQIGMEFCMGCAW